MTKDQRPDLTALLDSFAELQQQQQDIVAEYFIKRGIDVDRRGGMYAHDYPRLIACDLRGQHRQAFFDAVGRASLASWQPDAVAQ